MINKRKPPMYVMGNFICSQRGFFHLVMMFIRALLLFGLSAGIVHAETPNDVGNWLVNETVDPIDDSKTVNANLMDKGGEQFSQATLLWVVCQNNETSVAIIWRKNLLGDDAQQSVITRIGKTKATSSDWILALSSWGDSVTIHPQPILFLNALMKESKLAARVTHHEEGQLTAEWDLTGIENALKPIRETCGW